MLAFTASIAPVPLSATIDMPTYDDFDLQDNGKVDDSVSLLFSDSPPLHRPTSLICIWLGANQTKLYDLATIASGNVVLSIMTVLVKTAGKYLTSDEVVLLAVLHRRALQHLALKIPPFAVPPHFHVLVFFRSTIGYVAMSLSFYSFNTMVLSEASVIICSSPIVTFVMVESTLPRLNDFSFALECPLPPRKLRPTRFCLHVCSFLGVICVARPAFFFGSTSTTTSPPFSIATAVLAAIFLGIANIFVRKLHDFNTWTLVTYHLMTTAFFAGLKVLVFQSGFTIPTEPSRIVTLLAIGVLGCLGQVMVTKGFQVEKAGIASAMQYINTMCIMVWDVTLLGQTLHAFSVVGAAIIISSSTVVAYRRTKKAV
ncbi:Aste57867_12726 [Aphanomyces stellatus]|uniref:Aste57867_12726 protein n=1 Tax=Aphanomyces stellatus TaxID=120398 RepID=A0A485KWB9_9STRA|nr:hypothetical protein As57867_012678 [Aphanomyces stellatus]VFT89576.1 Aste57867_12726 [Aphanomyces stellatus]